MRAPSCNPTWEEHIKHLNLVCDRLRSAGLTVRSDKCTFGAGEVSFLGHQISGSTMRPADIKVAVLKKYSVPNLKKNGLTVFRISKCFLRICPKFLAR